MSSVVQITHSGILCRMIGCIDGATTVWADSVVRSAGGEQVAQLLACPPDALMVAVTLDQLGAGKSVKLTSARGWTILVPVLLESVS